MPKRDLTEVPVERLLERLGDPFIDGPVPAASGASAGDPPGGTPPRSAVVIEEATAELALAQVHRRMGADAQIVHAERVRRGGFAGFFAREYVRLHVEGATVAFADLLEQSFETPTASAARSAHVPVSPAVDPLPGWASPRRDDIGWSQDGLVRLGLPVDMVRGLAGIRSGDDVEWTVALADALRPLCRPLPAGRAVLVGPQAPVIGEIVSAPVARSDLWLRHASGGRWIHLVAGGEGWRHHLDRQPLALSWVSHAMVGEVIRCARDLGLVLGFAPVDGRIRRVRPLDVALAVRQQIRELNR